MHYFSKIKEVFKKSGIAVLVVLTFVTFLGFNHIVSSSALQNVSGFAWGADDWTDLSRDGIQNWVDTEPFNGVMDSWENEHMNPTGGMGWISFNRISDPSGQVGSQPADYGVNIDPVTGDIVGYAWTSNYGWLRFGGLSDFPTGGGTTPANAKLTGNTVTGWARFCAGTSNANCNGPAIPNTLNGGWDGWVSLSGTGYGITKAGNTLTGYAWGGDDDGANVVGWINFSNVTYNLITTASTNIIANGEEGTQDNPVQVDSGDPIVLKWESINLPAQITSCTAYQDWSGQRSISGEETQTPIINTGNTVINKAYQIACSDITNDTVYVQIIPEGYDCDPVTEVCTPCQNGNCPNGDGSSLDFYALPGSVPESHPYTTLYWNSNDNLTNCVADSSPSLNIATVSNWTGPQDDPNSSEAVDVPYSPTKYKITCEDSDGDLISETISVSKYEIELCENPNAINEGEPLPCEYDDTFCDGFRESFVEGHEECYCPSHSTDGNCVLFCTDSPAECRRQPKYIED